MSAPQDRNRNKDVRGAAVARQKREPHEPLDKPGKVPNKRSRALEDEPLEIPIFPAGSLVDNLMCNKTVSKGRAIFIQSVIGPRGTRQYQYMAEDSGQCFWSYRPIGFWL